LARYSSDRSESEILDARLVGVGHVHALMKHSGEGVTACG
jgi:hypothetical protein